MKYLRLIGLIIFSALLLSCSSGGGGGSDSSGTHDVTLVVGGGDTSASILIEEKNTFLAGVKDILNLFLPAEAVAGTTFPDCYEGISDIPYIPFDIDNISFIINGVIVGNVELVDFPLNENQADHCNPIIRTYTVQNGDNLFEAVAYGAEEELYRGSTPQTITGDDSVQIIMLDNMVSSLYSPEAGALMDNGCDDDSDPLHWEFQWSAVPGATSYNLQIIDNQTSYDYYLEGTSWIRDYYEHINDDNLDWSWRVRAMVNGYWRSWSEERNFDVEALNSDCPDDGCDLYVDVSNDSAYDGIENDCTNPSTPCRSISYALTQTDGYESICVFAGLYDRENETTLDDDLPFTLPVGTSLICQGPDHTTVIDNGIYGAEGRIYTGAHTIEGSEGSSVIGCSIINSSQSIDDNAGAMVIENNWINANGLEACEGIVVGNSGTVVRNNIIQDFNTSECDHSNAGIYVYFNATANITGNRISGVYRGIDIYSANPTLSGNTITGNRHGVYVAGNSQPVINENTISCNDLNDLRNNSINEINAQSNEWDHLPPLRLIECSNRGDDICGTTTNNWNGGPVDTTGASLAANPCSYEFGCATPVPSTEPMDNACTQEGQFDPMIWEFDWSDCEDATEYQLYVRNRSVVNTVIDLQGIETSSFTYDAGGGYTETYDNWFYRVRAMVNGLWGEWSEERNFTVEPVDTDCQQQEPQVFISPTDATVMGYSGDTVYFTASGGVPPYSWSNTGYGGSLTFPNETQAIWHEGYEYCDVTGEATVTVTDSEGNSATAIINIPDEDC